MLGFEGFLSLLKCLNFLSVRSRLVYSFNLPQCKLPLWNIIDRQIASVDDYAYSTALQSHSAKPWNFEELNAFLTKPKVYAKGTKMSYSGMKKPADRIAILLYLAAQGE